MASPPVQAPFLVLPRSILVGPVLYKLWICMRSHPHQTGGVGAQDADTFIPCLDMMHPLRNNSLFAVDWTAVKLLIRLTSKPRWPSSGDSMLESLAQLPTSAKETRQFLHVLHTTRRAMLRQRRVYVSHKFLLAPHTHTCCSNFSSRPRPLVCVAGMRHTPALARHSFGTRSSLQNHSCVTSPVAFRYCGLFRLFLVTRSPCLVFRCLVRSAFRSRTARATAAWHRWNPKAHAWQAHGATTVTWTTSSWGTWRDMVLG